jgi:ATP-dependent DNA helicase DinG
MARLVARALRVGRSALIQTDSLAAYQGSHRLSYLIPALLWPEPAILALPDELLETVLQQDIPNLQQGLPIVKPVRSGNSWPDDSFKGLLVTSAQGWLRDRLLSSHLSTSISTPAPNTGSVTESRFPTGIATIIDGAGALERWAQNQLSETLCAQDWEALMLAYPSQREFIRDMRVRLTHAIFQHPANPYGCHLIEEPEQALLYELYDWLQTFGDSSQLPLRWQRFWQRFAPSELSSSELSPSELLQTEPLQTGPSQTEPLQTERLAWSSLDRELGSVVLHCGPTDINSSLAPVWAQQPIVLIGAALAEDTRAERYRDRMGLGDMTCLRFGPDRRNDLVQLYLPDRLPMPNTSHFKGAVLQEIRTLLSARGTATDPTVIVIGDVPLKAQFAAILAAEFGSRVQLEAAINDQGILITGWDYWRQQQANFTAPGLLIITTLPIPSLENPLVAGRVAAYKRRQQDWFKAYLLPEALSELQHAIAPMRSRINPLMNQMNQNGHQGVVALLDNRVNYRSYGTHVLAALSPAARSSYLNEDWFNTAVDSP